MAFPNLCLYHGSLLHHHIHSEPAWFYSTLLLCDRGHVLMIIPQMYSLCTQHIQFLLLIYLLMSVGWWVQKSARIVSLSFACIFLPGEAVLVLAPILAYLLKSQALHNEKWAASKACSFNHLGGNLQSSPYWGMAHTGHFVAGWWVIHSAHSWQEEADHCWLRSYRWGPNHWRRGCHMVTRGHFARSLEVVCSSCPTLHRLARGPSPLPTSPQNDLQCLTLEQACEFLSWGVSEMQSPSQKCRSNKTDCTYKPLHVTYWLAKSVPSQVGKKTTLFRLAKQCKPKAITRVLVTRQ